MKNKKGIKPLLLIFSVILLFSCSFMVVSLADSTEEATLTTEAKNSSPVTTHGSLDELMATAISARPTVKTTYTVTLNKDAALGRYNFSGNSNASVVLNLNGYTLTDPNNATASNVFTLRKDNGQDKNQNVSSLTINGADAQGNRGKIITKNGKYFVFNNGLNSLKLSFNDIDIDYTHCNSTMIQSGIIYIYTGNLALDNVHITYRGTADGSTNDSVMGFVRDVRPTGDFSYIKNCSFTDASENVITAALTQSKQTVELINCKIDADYGVYYAEDSNQSKSISFTECEVNVKNSLSALTVSKTVLTKTTVTVASGTLNELSGPVYIYSDGDGTNSNKIITDESISSLLGDINVLDDFIIVKTSKNTFEFIPPDTNITTLKMSSLFSSGMVIQREKEINVWGYVNTDGVTVNVTLDGVTEETTVSDGKFLVSFPAMSAKRDVEMNISIPDAVGAYIDITYKDIDVGDVWIMSGQSNIDYSTKYMEDIDEYLANADNYRNLRFFYNPSKWEIYENTVGYGKWYDATRENLENVGASAIGYVMATRLAAEFDDVTIAIMDCSYAGTMIQTWIDAETYSEMISDETNSYYSHTTLEAYRAYYEANGKMPSQKSDLESYFTNSTAYSKFSDDEFNKPYRVVASVCYNALIAPLKGMAAKGIVWYQGEGNVIGDRYIPYYEALTASYRKTFDDSSLPFYVIQLAPYVSSTYNAGVSDTKSAQFKMVEVDANSYLISANLEGATTSVQDMTSGKNSSASLTHPARKSPIGHRLADSVLKNTYGKYENRVTTAPKPVKAELSGSSVIITFDAPLSLLYGTEVEGFELSDGSGFVKANGVISGNTVTLTADGIEVPTMVRYAYGFLTFELEDGRLLTVISCTEYPGTTGKMTVVDENGNEHSFTAAEGGVIRGFIEGNLTNASGHPAPTFSLDVGYGTNP